MQVRLKVMQGSNTGKEVKIPSPQCVIGREEGCHLRPHSDAISRKHCIILTTENEVIVRDLKSRNGTFVNDEPVTGEAVLLHGDMLRVGPLEFELLIEQAPGKPKRSRVADIKEAVARTAEGSGVSGSSELDDITRWLEEADSEELTKRASPETRQFRLDETMSPADTDAATAKASDTKSLAGDLKRPEKKLPGKLPPRPSTNKADSREAAADMLKRFFNRR